MWLLSIFSEGATVTNNPPDVELEDDLTAQIDVTTAPEARSSRGMSFRH